MVSWSEGSISSDDGDSASSVVQLPPTILCTEWSGLATDLSERCEHECACEKLVSFESVDSGRRFLACAQKDIPKCSYLEWVDPEWPAILRMCLARIWGMYDDENKLRLRQAVVQAEENLRVVKEKEKMEKDLRFFKVDFAKMVADKEQALTELGNTRIALNDLRQELEKKNLSDKSATSLHQVVRAKAEKERELMMQERDQLKAEKDQLKADRDQLKAERDNLVLERDELKKQKKKLEYMIGDLFKHKEATKDKVRKIKEQLEEI